MGVQIVLRFDLFGGSNYLEVRLVWGFKLFGGLESNCLGVKLLGGLDNYGGHTMCKEEP